MTTGGVYKSIMWAAGKDCLYGDGVTAHILLSLSQVTSVQIEEHTLKFQNKKNCEFVVVVVVNLSAKQGQIGLERSAS